MKKIAIALLTMVSFYATAGGEITGTHKVVDVDSVTYERVFLGCLSTFKVDAKKPAEDLSDLVEVCQKSAQKIASQSEYVGTDDKYYITIKPRSPSVPKESGAGVKQIMPIKN